MNCDVSVSSLPFRRGASGPSDVLPEPLLFAALGLVDLQANDLTAPQAQRLAARHQTAAARVIQERERGPLLLDVVTVQQQRAAAQRGLALPEARQRLALGRALRRIGGAQHAQLHAQRSAGEGGHRAFARAFVAAEMDDRQGPDLIRVQMSAMRSANARCDGGSLRAAAGASEQPRSRSSK